MRSIVRRWPRGAQVVAAMTLALLAVPANAGVVDGVHTVGDLTIYLGAVPAAIVRGHAPSHPEAQMHGGAPGPGHHAVHLVVALFDKFSGARVTKATVTARIGEQGGKETTVRLEPMTVNGALTFGGYTDIKGVNDYRIDIVISRPPQPQPPGHYRPPNPVTARFTYVHD